MSALEIVVKNTFAHAKDSSLQADPRRCASEPPRHRHHDRAAEPPKPFDCIECTSDVSGSKSCSFSHDSLADEGSCLGSESGDVSMSIPNSPACSLPRDFNRTCKPQSYRSPAQLGNANSVRQSVLHQNKNTVGDRINMFDASQKSLQLVGVLQSQRELVMKSLFGHEVDTAHSAEVRMHHRKQSATSQGVGRSKEYEKPSLKGRNCNAAPRTLMICNLPCRLAYDDLIEAINSVGFGDAFEFVHLPHRYKQQGSNLGYAFINLFDPADVALFASAFEGYHFSHKESSKACSVKIANFQGFNASYRRMQRDLRRAESK